MSPRVAYLCLQATQEGQASFAHVHEIIAGLRRRGWVVDLFEPGYARSDARPALPGRLREVLRVQARLWRAAKAFDLLYVRAHAAAFPTALWARARGIPTVQEVNGPYQDLFIANRWAAGLAWLLTRGMRTALRLADALIVVTPQLAEWAGREVGRKPIHVIPNGANVDLFHPSAPVPRSLARPYVVFVGYLARWQGIDTLLEAAERPEWPPAVRLVVVGDGLEQAKVEAAAARNARIVYLGRLAYREVPGVLAGSLAALSPQNNRGGRSETGLYPLKVFEALACGVPVVVTDFPGQADLVRRHGCGLVVPPEDPPALARAVARLHGDPDGCREMGGRGRLAVEREHSWDARAAQTARVLGEQLAGAEGRRPARRRC